MSRRLAWLLALVLVASASWFAREAQNRRVEIPGRQGWFTTDPDSQYHMRRLERALAEGHVAERDERLDAPRGSAIPWPPYYTRFLAFALGPFAPDADRASWIERAVGSAAFVASLLTSLLALAVAWKLAGPAAGLAAGLAHAFHGAAIEYGKLGNGDHHAFVSLVSGVVLALTGAALTTSSLDSKRRALWLGVLAGLLAGLALGSWVAALILIAEVQLVLALLTFMTRRRETSLGVFAFAFHASALFAVAPALASSPWRETQPWIVINLSWFHAAYLALAGVAFLPLALAGRYELVRARFPAWIAMLAALVAAFLLFSEAAPARGVREGWEWVSRADSFMARIGESQPLLRDGGLAPFLRMLGFAGFAWPILCVALARWSWRGEWTLLPWTIALAVLGLQALGQSRFAEGLALPLAVGLGVGLARGLSRVVRERLAAPWIALLAAAIAVLASGPAVARSLERWSTRKDALRFERPAQLGARLGAEWISSVPERVPGESVLAVWTHGHLIERVAGRASVATNFGSYVGVEGFRASPQMLLCEDEEDLLRRMEERRVRFALVDSDLPNALNTLLDGADPAARGRYTDAASDEGGNIRPEWFLTFGARAMFDGAVFGPLGAKSKPLSRLRLVWIAPLKDPARGLRSPRDLAPAAWVWERVGGARLEASGSAGETLEVLLEVDFPGGKRVEWSDAAPVGKDGVARLTAPYSTLEPNGIGGPARLSARVGARRVSGELSERAVLAGESVVLR
jgi:hypothetical protein